jgi:hypothetical protein
MRTAVGLPVALTRGPPSSNRPPTKRSFEIGRFGGFPRRIDGVEAPSRRVRDGHHGESILGQTRMSSGPLRGMMHRERGTYKAAASIAGEVLVAPHPALALAAGMCFDSNCQESMDRIFLLVISLPLLALAAAVAWAYRPYREQEADGRKVRLCPCPRA